MSSEKLNNVHMSGRQLKTVAGEKQNDNLFNQEDSNRSNPKAGKRKSNENGAADEGLEINVRLSKAADEQSAAFFIYQLK